MPHRPARQRDRRGDAAQVAAHQRDVAGLDRDVGAGADRDADVGLRERRRVVDAVADHRDDLPGGLPALDLRDFALGQHARDDRVDAGLPRDRFAPCADGRRSA